MIAASQYLTSISNSIKRPPTLSIVRITAPSESRIQNVPLAGTFPPLPASWITVGPSRSLKSTFRASSQPTGSRTRRLRNGSARCSPP